MEGVGRIVKDALCRVLLGCLSRRFFVQVACRCDVGTPGVVRRAFIKVDTFLSPNWFIKACSPAFVLSVEPTVPCLKEKAFCNQKCFLFGCNPPKYKQY